MTTPPPQPVPQGQPNPTPPEDRPTATPPATAPQAPANPPAGAAAQPQSPAQPADAPEYPLAPPQAAAPDAGVPAHARAAAGPAAQAPAAATNAPAGAAPQAPAGAAPQAPAAAVPQAPVPAPAGYGHPAQGAAAPGYWPGQAPAAGGGYVSPIPVRKATLADALLAEWTKIRSVRSTMWTLGVMIALIIGIGGLIATVLGGADTSVSRTPLPLFGMYGVLLATICVITLGVFAISVEYGTGLIRTTLTACPDRARVLTAKAIVFASLTFVVTLVSTSVVAALHSAVLSDRIEVQPTVADWLRATVGVSLFMAALGLVALGIGALVRHSAGAITSMLGVILLPYVMAMFMYSESLMDVREALIEYSVPVQLIGLYVPDSGPQDFTADGPIGWMPVLIVAIAAAVSLGGAYAALLKRDA
ncbi:ABC transporter permease [Streptomyces sp. NPDC049585]|uniref:ABC transporter permease n=1 Tax=Streptomyces sp. NPDC049585 TaxID=3155154 RepID=UPI003445D470